MSIPETMKAVYLVEPFKLEVREVSTPKIERDTDVLVKVHTVGVCGSDLTAWKGNHPDMKMPSIPGHEIAGEVVAVGSAVTKVKVGDVTYGPTKETMTTREPLHAGEIIRAKDGEWHLFDFDSEDGFLSIIAFFGVPIGHTKEE